MSNAFDYCSYNYTNDAFDYCTSFSLAQLAAMSYKIGYPKFITNMTEVDDIYRTVGTATTPPTHSQSHPGADPERGIGGCWGGGGGGGGRWGGYTRKKSKKGVIRGIFFISRCSQWSSPVLILNPRPKKRVSVTLNTQAKVCN